MFKKVFGLISACFIGLFVSASNALATPLAVTDMWSALTITDLNQQVITVSLIVIALCVIGITLHIIMRVGKSAKKAL